MIHETDVCFELDRETGRLVSLEILTDSQSFVQDRSEFWRLSKKLEGAMQIPSRFRPLPGGGRLWRDYLFGTSSWQNSIRSARELTRWRFEDRALADRAEAFRVKYHSQQVS